MQVVNKSLVSGYINIPNIQPDQVHIEDLAHRTSNICRFNGAIRCFFSVAQHSMEVAKLCMENAENFNVDPYEAGLAGLLHDVPEGIYGDMISPVKHTIGPAYKKVTKPADNAIYQALGVTDIMTRCKYIVDWADLEMLVSDAARWHGFGNFMSAHGVEFTIETPYVVPHPYTLRFPDAFPMWPLESKQPFLEMYYNLRSIVMK